MPKDFPRTRRLGEQIQRELSDLIRSEVRDPRVGMVTVSGVDVTRDLAHAKVFIAVLGADAEQVEATLQGLGNAAGYLRKLLGQRLHVRMVPALHFHYDDSFDRGARLSKLINDAVSRDRDDDA